MIILTTLSTIRSFPRFCKMFSESSTIVMQLPYCLGKQGELSENCLQNLRNDLMADSVKAMPLQQTCVPSTLSRNCNNT